MEALVIKVLKKQLKLFIKNFNADQLTVSAMKGEGQMTDLNLNEKVIQELLYIPMNLEVTRASCDLLNLKVPWTSLNSKPVTLTLNKVDIDLREPAEIVHTPSNLKRKPKTKGDVTDNMQIIVNNVHMTVQTIGGSLVMIDLDDILIQSTNGKWEVVDLAQARDIDKDQGIETLYKKVTVRSINVALITEKSAHMILSQVPLKILFTSKRRSKDWALLKAGLEFILDNITFRWTQSELLLMVELIKGFQACLTRQVPPSPLLKSTSDSALSAMAAKPDVSYTLRIVNWAVDFEEKLIPVEKGYSFFGDNLVIVFNSAKNVTVKSESSGSGSPSLTATNIEVEETLISVLINTVKFRELAPREHTSPFIVTQRDATPSSADKPLLKASLTLRRPTATTSSPTAAPLIGIELLLALSNLQLVADRTVWKSLIRFLAGADKSKLPSARPASPTKPASNPSSPRSASAAAEASLDEAKNKLTQLKDRLKLTDDWQNQIKISVKASDLRVVIPGESSGEYEGLSLHLDLGSFGVNNNADWKITPNLTKGLAILAAPSPAPPISSPKTVGPPHKLSFHLEGVAMAVHGQDKVTPILEPAGVNLFVHYFEREGKEKGKGKPQLEVVFHSGQFNLHANEKQYPKRCWVSKNVRLGQEKGSTAPLCAHHKERSEGFLTWDIFSYLGWVGRKYLNPRKVAAALSARVKQAKEIASEKIKDFQSSVPQSELIVNPIKDKVSNALEAYKWTVYVHIDKGVFTVPLQYFLAPPTDAPPKPQVVFDPLSANPNTSVTEVIEGEIEKPCEVKFEHLDLALENNVNGQSVVLQLATFHAAGLDHPKLPSVISLVPIVGQEDEKLPEGINDVESLVFRYKRKRKNVRSGDSSPVKGDDEFITEVLGRLQRMLVKIARKPDHPGFNTGGMGLPDVQAMINRAVALIQERKDDIKLVQQNVKQINLDVKWTLELGNCEVSLERADNPAATGNIIYKPYGTLRLVDAVRPSLVKNCKDFENRLVTAKFTLAQNEVEKEEKNVIIQGLQIWSLELGRLLVELVEAVEQAALGKADADKQAAINKLKDEYNNLEMKLVQTKMAMAQLQEEIDTSSNNKGKRK